MEEVGMLKKREDMPRLDVELAINASPFNGDRYVFILEAARRARVISKRRDGLDRNNEKLNFYGYKPLNQAIKDIIDESTDSYK
jgi:hypothetical protein